MTSRSDDRFALLFFSSPPFVFGKSDDIFGSNATRRRRATAKHRRSYFPLYNNGGSLFFLFQPNRSMTGCPLLFRGHLAVARRPVGYSDRKTGSPRRVAMPRRNISEAAYLLYRYDSYNNVKYRTYDNSKSP